MEAELQGIQSSIYYVVTNYTKHTCKGSNSTFLCPTGTDRRHLEPIGFRADTQFPLGIRLVPSGSNQIPSGFQVEIGSSESYRFQVDSDRNLTLFF